MPKFGANSKKHLAGAHPLLQQLFNEVVKDIDCMVLDSQRGRQAQEKAFKLGNSKAHFGQSAHNWSPSVALDVVPYPLDWEDTAAFKALAKVVLAKARVLAIPVSWGGAWAHFKDYPHYELDPWRVWAKKDCKPFEG